MFMNYTAYLKGEVNRGTSAFDHSIIYHIYNIRNGLREETNDRISSLLLKMLSVSQISPVIFIADN